MFYLHVSGWEQISYAVYLAYLGHKSLTLSKVQEIIGLDDKFGISIGKTDLYIYIYIYIYIGKIT